MSVTMHDVDSTQLAKIGWAKDKGLVVIFQGGNHVYHYPKAPQSVFEDLLASDSVGSTFNRLVKGKFPHTKHDIDATPRSQVQEA